MPGRSFVVWVCAAQPDYENYETATRHLKRRAFDPIPRDAEAAAKQGWQGQAIPVEGHANVWAPMSVDAARGLVFLPASSPSPDFFGGLRPGDNRYADSVIALDAATGTVRWAFQTVHHDVWDYDLAAQPLLVMLTIDGAARAGEAGPSLASRVLDRPGRRFCRRKR